MWFNLTKRDKPAYLRYKRGKIFEHERTERVHLNQALDEISDEDETVFDLSHPPDEQTPKKRVLKGVGLFGFLLFIVLFLSLIGTYTASLFGEKQGEAIIDLTDFSLPIGDSDQTDLSLDITVPDVSLPDVSLPDLDVDVSMPSLTEAKDTPLGGETTDSSPAQTPSGSLFAFSVSIHEELNLSTQRLRDSVVRYADQRNTRLSVRSQVDKEKLTYASLRDQVEKATFTSDVDDAYKATVKTALYARLDGIEQDADTILAADRSAIVSTTNTFIANENERRQAFITLLKSGLDAYSIPYTEANGSLNF